MSDELNTTGTYVKETTKSEHELIEKIARGIVQATAEAGHNIDFDHPETRKYAISHAKAALSVVGTEVLRLRAENETLRAAVLDLRGQVEAEQEQARKDAFYVADLLHEIEKLRAALKPFADAADDLDDVDVGCIYDHPAANSIDCKHLRAAATALKGTDNGTV